MRPTIPEWPSNVANGLTVKASESFFRSATTGFISRLQTETLDLDSVREGRGADPTQQRHRAVSYMQPVQSVVTTSGGGYGSLLPDLRQQRKLTVRYMYFVTATKDSTDKAEADA